MSLKNPDTEALFKVIASLKTPDEVKKFFIDLCTPAEINAMTGRWKAAQMIEKGIPYREIYELSGVSTATITRIARCLSFGTGGYQLAMDKVAEIKKPSAKKISRTKEVQV